MNGKNIEEKKEGVEDLSPELMFDKFEFGKVLSNIAKLCDQIYLRLRISSQIWIYTVLMIN
jgi:hypothetical protein